MPKLVISERGSDKETVQELTHEGATIGRSEENIVKLPDKNASRQHASIVIESNEFFLIDLESGNGTFLNGARIKPREKVLLRHGDVITVGNHNLRFQHLDEILASSFNEITDSDILEVKLLKKVLRAIDKESVPSIEVLNGTFVGKKFFLSDDMNEAVIGRDPTCDFPIEEYVISRQHAKITKKWSGISIQDLNSKNGTYVNNKRVTEVALHDGDRLALGTIVLIFRNPKEVNLEAVGERMKREREKTASEQPQAEEAYEEMPQMPVEVPEVYPTPRPKSELISLSYFEMAMVGLGVLILVFATVSFINLMSK